jgi:hypothetical protein
MPASTAKPRNCTTSGCPDRTLITPSWAELLCYHLAILSSLVDVTSVKEFCEWGTKNGCRSALALLRKCNPAKIRPRAKTHCTRTSDISPPACCCGWRCSATWSCTSQPPTRPQARRPITRIRAWATAGNPHRPDRLTYRVAPLRAAKIALQADWRAAASLN